jgi:hypothetical protein
MPSSIYTPFQTGEGASPIGAPGVSDYERIETNPDMFGGGIGKAAEGLGRTLEKVSQDAFSVNALYGRVAADDQRNQFTKNADNLLYGDPGKTVQGPDGTMKPDTGVLGLKGQDALNAGPAAVQAIEKARQDGRANLSGPALIQYDNETARIMQTARVTVSTHVQQQATQWYQTVNKDGEQQALQRITRAPDDPLVLQGATADLIKYRTQAAQISLGNTLTPEMQKSIIQGAKADALTTQLTMIAVKDPAKALTMADGNKDILGEAYPKIANELRTRAQAQTADQTADNAFNTHYIEGQPAPAPKAASTDQEGAPKPQQPFKESAGPAPGAYGYGLINAPYRAPLDQKSYGVVAPSEFYKYLKANGASNNEALLLSGAAASESSFNPKAVHDGGKGYGLFGHNTGRLDMRGKTWEQQATAALKELRGRPEHNLVAAATSPEQLADAEMHFEAPQGYTSANPRGGHNYTGRLNTLRYFQQMANGTFSGSQGAPTASNIPPEGIGAGPEHPQFGNTPPTPQQISADIQNRSVGDTGTPAPAVAPAQSVGTAADTGGAPAPTASVGAEVSTGAPVPGAAAAAPAPQQVVMGVGAPQPAAPLAAVLVSEDERAANAYTAIENDPNLSEEQKQRAAARLGRRIGTHRIATEATAKAIKQQSDAASETYLRDMYSGDPAKMQGMGERIAADHHLTGEAVEKLESIMDRRLMMSGDPSVQWGKGFADLFKRVTLPMGDPNRISDPQQLVGALAANQVNFTGFDKLNSYMKAFSKAPDQQIVMQSFASIMSGMKRQLSNEGDSGIPGMPGIKDPAGEKIFYTQYYPQMLMELEKAIQGGKEREFLSDTKHFDEMAKQLRSAEDLSKQKLSADAAPSLSPDTSPTAGNLPPAPPTANPDAWRQLVSVKAQGIAPDGSKFTFSPAQIAKPLQTLFANPSDQMKEFWDRQAGPGGKTLAQMFGFTAEQAISFMRYPVPYESDHASSRKARTLNPEDFQPVKAGNGGVIGPQGAGLALPTQADVSGAPAAGKREPPPGSHVINGKIMVPNAAHNGWTEWTGDQ